MRQIRSATASNFVPMPPGRFHPHRHLRVTPRHGSARSVAGEGQSRSLERSRRHDDEEMAAMAEEPKRDPVRSLSNRIFLTISGKWFRAYSIVRHVGRTSGRQYRNPVSAYPLTDGFVIAVLYGAQSHWVRNVMAAGRFTLRTKGRDYLLERPEIIAARQALPAFPALYRRMLRSRGTGDFVWAHRAERSADAIYRHP